MAYRKTSRRSFQYSPTAPVWTCTQTDTVTLAFQALLSKLGINDVPSYFRRLKYVISISVIVCACIGAATDGSSGLFLGGLAGLLAPAAMLWFAVLLVGIAIFQWFLSEYFRF
jgi:hypothetical protein